MTLFPQCTPDLNALPALTMLPTAIITQSRIMITDSGSENIYLYDCLMSEIIAKSIVMRKIEIFSVLCTAVAVESARK